MSNINIAGRMAKKVVTKNTAGQIINLLDETNGGWIIRGGRVVNEEAYNKLVQKENDRKESAKAIVNQVEAPKEVQDMRAGKVPLPKVDVEQVKTEAVPTKSKVDMLEDKVNDMDNKLDKILNALK